VGSIEKIEIKNQFTKSYRDLLARGHGGAMNHYLGTAKFDGKKYQIKECFEEIRSTDGSSSLIRRNPTNCQ
jgi:hypothetical protein